MGAEKHCNVINDNELLGSFGYLLLLIHYFHSSFKILGEFAQ